MKRCPDPLTWQAVADGEEPEAPYREHLQACPHCRSVYAEIMEAVTLGARLQVDKKLPADLERKILAHQTGQAFQEKGYLEKSASPWDHTAGLVSAGLFASLLLALALLMWETSTFYLFDTGAWVRHFSIFFEYALGTFLTLAGVSPLFWAVLSLALVVVVVIILNKIGT